MSDKNEIAETNNQLAETPQDNPPMTVANQLLSMAIDKDLDIDKLQRLIDMRDQEEIKTAKSQFVKAMAQVQAEIEPIIADKDNDQTGSKYARLKAIIAGLKPVYTSHGFSVSYGTGECGSKRLVEAGWFRVSAELSHVGGYSKEFFIDLPADTVGAKGSVNKTVIHGTKSTLTYARGMLMGLMFNFSTSDDVDDDGNAAGIDPITDKQLIELKDHIETLKIDTPKFFKYLGITDLEHMPAAKWPMAMTAIERKQKALES